MWVAGLWVSVGRWVLLPTLGRVGRLAGRRRICLPSRGHGPEGLGASGTEGGVIGIFSAAPGTSLHIFHLSLPGKLLILPGSILSYGAPFLNPGRRAPGNGARAGAAGGGQLRVVPGYEHSILILSPEMRAGEASDLFAGRQRIGGHYISWIAVSLQKCGRMTHPTSWLAVKESVAI